MTREVTGRLDEVSIGLLDDEAEALPSLPPPHPVAPSCVFSHQREAFPLTMA